MSGSAVKVDYKQAAELLSMFGGEPTIITLMAGPGHSGEGLYGVYDADPEGSIFLGQADDDARPMLSAGVDTEALLRQTLGALEYHVEQTRPIDRTTAAISAIRNALASATPSSLTEPAEAIRKLLATVTADNQIIDSRKWLAAMEGVRASLNTPAQAPAIQAPEVAPIDMVLHCPACGLQHIDAPEPLSGLSPVYRPATGWKNPPHRSHLCHGCDYIWRPADVPTNGVQAVKTTGNADSPIATRSAAVSAGPAAPTRQQIKDLALRLFELDVDDIEAELLATFATAHAPTQPQQGTGSGKP